MRTELGGGASVPPYPFSHEGPVLVCGNALCLHDDLARAPDAPVIAVNGAAREIKAIALYSKHPGRFVEPPFLWIGRQRKFGDDFTVHGSNLAKNGPISHVNYWWEDARGGGGSAWGARKLAWLMGFDPVILCGCPLVTGPYTDYRPGEMMTREDVVEGLRLEIEADTEWHEGVCSMSGWTRELLGEPS